MPFRVYEDLASAAASSSVAAQPPLECDPTAHLLCRLTFGPTSVARNDLASQSLDAWYQNQRSLASTTTAYEGIGDILPSVAPNIGLSSSAAYSWAAGTKLSGTFALCDQLSRATIASQIASPAQLFEILADVFSNHLNVPAHTNSVWYSRADYDRSVIRAHIGGRFSDMLAGSCKHPAMLAYLNLAASSKSAVNENYARELLECHTVGLHYTEADVTNVARALTGRTIGPSGGYIYDPALHAGGSVRVLGFRGVSHGSGEGLGDSILDYLAHHKLTALTIASKLCVRFVSDSPSQGLLEATAKAYLDNDTRILPMLDVIVRSNEFWESRGKKVRTPAQRMISAVRAAEPVVTDWAAAAGTLQWITQCLGNSPLDWPFPNGYPDVAAAWRGSGGLLGTWSGLAHITSGRVTGMSQPTLAALTQGAASGSDVITRLFDSLTAALPSQSDLSAMEALLAATGGDPASTAAAQSAANDLGAAILFSPYHALH